MKLVKIAYSELNTRQKEAFNYQKLSALLADYGLNTIRLSSDWEGADFIAQHCTTFEFMAVQLKGRFELRKSYRGKRLWIAFPEGGTWYLYDHDAVLEAMSELKPALFTSKSWLRDDGFYSFSSLAKDIRNLLKPYIVEGGGS